MTSARGAVSTRKTVLPFSSRSNPRVPKTDGSPLRFTAVRSASTPFLTSLARAAASLKRSNTSGQACRFQQTLQLALMSAEPNLFFGDQSAFIFGFRLALLARNHFLGSKHFHCFTVDR